MGYPLGILSECAQSISAVYTSFGVIRRTFLAFSVSPLPPRKGVLINLVSGSVRRPGACGFALQENDDDER